MRYAKEEVSCRTEQVIDLISVVKELHGLSSQELSKLIRDSENNTLQHTTETGSSIQIDVEKFARYLPLHLVAMLLSSERDEALFRYLLCGFRLLHSLCDLASRHPKLEQILLDDVKVSEQLLDLIFYLLIVLGAYRQEHFTSIPVVLLHSTLVACSLYLLTGYISSQWQELAQVLLSHPKVDIFMDVAFSAVGDDIKLLQITLSTQCTDSYLTSRLTAEGTLNHLCQQCEASLQFLQSLCQQKLFRERLVKNKELCGKGGVLWLAQLIMNLCISPSLKQSSSVAAAVSRLKSKVLSILLHLCEAESVSYLDEIASTPGSLDLAKSVALEVLELLKTMFSRDLIQFTACSDKNYPRGILQLNAMSLVDVFSDDSNFRSYITTYFTEVLTAIFSHSHEEFLSSWCSSDLPVWEEDASLEYDPFTAAGWVLDLSSLSDVLILRNPESTFIPCNMPRASYAHQRTSLLVKVIANLHCFAPDICKEEKDLFLDKFLQCLQKEFPKLSNEFSFMCDAEKATIVCRNLRSLLSHAESLIPSFLNKEDVQLLRVFISELESVSTSTEFKMNRVQDSKLEGSISWEKLSKLNISEHHQEAQVAGGCSSRLGKKVSPDLNNRSDNLKEGMSENSSFQEVNLFYARGNSISQVDGGMSQDKRRDKGKPGRDAARDLREIDSAIQNVETSGSDSSSTRGKNSIYQLDNLEFPKSSDHIKESGLGGVQEDQKVETVQCEEKHRRKRKRTIMNYKQMTLIEKALLDEPDMQRHASSVQSWADKLSEHGSVVTTSQLKNWLNNRKARLARVAKLGGSATGPLYDSFDSPVEDVEHGGSAWRTGTDGNMGTARAELDHIAPAKFVQCEPGKYVALVDAQGEEIGKGNVYRVHGKWHGRNLEESKMCVVDIIELKRERWMRLPHPCEVTGTSFDQAEKKLGVMRVLWDSNKLFML